METETGWVKELKDGNAVLQLKSKSKCSHCGAKMICGAGNGVTRELIIPNSLLAKVGDQVEISYQESSRILSAFLVFIAPIILLITGYIFGFNRSQSETIGAVWALIGLVVGFLILWLMNKILGKRRAFVPQMVRIVTNDQTGKFKNHSNNVKQIHNE
jgi:sigma-E factor negative regulatory protein RseC